MTSFDRGLSLDGVLLSSALTEDFLPMRGTSHGIESLYRCPRDHTKQSRSYREIRSTINLISLDAGNRGQIPFWLDDRVGTGRRRGRIVVMVALVGRQSARHSEENQDDEMRCDARRSHSLFDNSHQGEWLGATSTRGVVGLSKSFHTEVWTQAECHCPLAEFR